MTTQLPDDPGVEPDPDTLPAGEKEGGAILAICAGFVGVVLVGVIAWLAWAA